jgi:hypothetical protein
MQRERPVSDSVCGLTSLQAFVLGAAVCLYDADSDSHRLRAPAPHSLRQRFASKIFQRHNYTTKTTPLWIVKHHSPAASAHKHGGTQAALCAIPARDLSLWRRLQVQP